MVSNGSKRCIMKRKFNIVSENGSLKSQTPSDNELLAAVRDKSGTESKDAVSLLISRYMKLVLKRAHFFSGDYSDVEDLTQEGLLALYKAIESYDPERSPGFAAYADTCVSNRIKTVAAGFAKINSRVSHVENDSDAVSEDISPENIWVEKENASSINKAVLSVLSAKEAKVFGLYVSGMSYKEIAEQLDISEKSVDNAIFRIRKKLRALSVG